jgi:hypothetical protein
MTEESPLTVGAWARAWAEALQVPVYLDRGEPIGLVTLDPAGPGRLLRMHPDCDLLAFPDPAGPAPLRIGSTGVAGRSLGRDREAEARSPRPATGGLLRGPVVPMLPEPG